MLSRIILIAVLGLIPLAQSEVILRFPQIHNDGLIKIVVIDSGYSGNSKQLCKSGSYDAIKNAPSIGEDTLEHGTHVLDAIEEEIGPKFKDEYCFIVIKVFGDYGTNDPFEISALQYRAIYRAYIDVLRLKPEFVNMSYSGGDGSTEEDNLVEKTMVKHLTHTTFVASAGNHRREGELNLDKACNVFPACLGLEFKNMFAVGGYIVKGIPHPNSAYGRIIKLWAPFCNEDQTFCGTSYSAPVVTGFLVKKYLANAL